MLYRLNVTERYDSYADEVFLGGSVLQEKPRLSERYPTLLRRKYFVVAFSCSQENRAMLNERRPMLRQQTLSIAMVLFYQENRAFLNAIQRYAFIKSPP